MVVPCVEGFLLELASEDLLGAVEDVEQVGVVRVRVVQKQVVGLQFNLNKEYRRYKFFSARSLLCLNLISFWLES